MGEEECAKDRPQMAMVGDGLGRNQGFNVPHDSLAVQHLEGIGFRRSYAGVAPGVTCSVPDAAHEVDFILASRSAGAPLGTARPSYFGAWNAPLCG